MKAYKPFTLQDAISRTQDLQDSVPKNRFQVKTNFPMKDKDKKPFLQECPKKNWVDDDTRKQLRRKKVCFICQEPWIPGHRCAGKAKTHYIEVYFTIPSVHIVISHRGSWSGLIKGTQRYISES